MFKKSKGMLLVFILGLIISSFGSNMVYALNSDNIDVEKSSNLENTDMPSQWAKQEIEWTKSYGLVSQNLLSDFQDNITREELCTLSIKFYEKITQKEASSVENNPFIDTDNIDVLKAYKLNIISDVKGDTFEPNRNATREEIANTFYNAIKAAEPNLSLDVDHELKFIDKDEISDLSLEAIRYMNAKNILNGKSNNKIAPKDNCTREEALVLVKRIYEIVIKEIGKASKGLMWRVYDDNSEVYVLGSIHIANSDIYPLSDNIENAYEKADYLAVEANILQSNNEKNISYINQKAVYQDESTLKDNVSKETYENFNIAIQKLGFTYGQLDSVKPWYAALLLQNLNMAQASYEGTMGIDFYFLLKALNQKDILEVEGIKFQIDLFDSFSLELQEQFLIGVLNGISEEPEESKSNEKPDENIQMEIFENMLVSWKNGEKEDFEEIIKASRTDTNEESKDFDEKFWHERNKHMTETIIKFLADKNDSTYFVVVGAGHLVGEDGIINSLKEQGYTLEEVK